jgi:uncharacterized protein (DUF362 family)
MTSRRQFLLGSAAAVAAYSMPPTKTRVGLIHSSNKLLNKPVAANHPLDYELVRDMVWNAIKLGKPAAGSLEAKIKPGSWVVMKPNYCFLPGHPQWCVGDDTDMRMVRAVLEYVAQFSKAKRITIAEGGSYRRMGDTDQGSVIMQDGQHVDLTSYKWAPDVFPGLGGSYGALIKEMSAKYPDKQIDYVDLAYDVVTDAAGNFLELPVPVRNGVGSFSNKKVYFVTNAVTKCDFFISLPVLKMHENCGVTCCFKNYVGTGPRIAYGRRNMTNSGLHNEHSVDTRIDPFIGDLAAFHPPDYNVVDIIRGLQYTEHGNRQPDQLIQTNMIMAGENPVSLDAIAATLTGYRPTDIDYLHMAEARGLGSYDLNDIEVVGDEPDRYYRKWVKPRSWYARANRDWRVTGDPAQAPRDWKKFTSFGDMLNLNTAAGDAPSYSVMATVRSDGARKGSLWLGLTGAGTVELNGQKILQEESQTRFRIGQFRQDVELRAGDNQLVIKIQPANGKAALGAFIANPANNGDSLEGVAWTA